MINPTELRLGNIVHPSIWDEVNVIYDPENDIPDERLFIEIAGIGSRGEIEIKRNNDSENIGEMEFKMIHPVVLTEQIILTICKFRHHPIGLNYLIHINNAVEFDLMLKPNENGGFQSCGSGPRVNIQTLHHLQNYYFALTGAELKINLKHIYTHYPFKK